MIVDYLKDEYRSSESTPPKKKTERERGLARQHRELQHQNRNGGGGDGKQGLHDPAGKDWIDHESSPLSEFI
jgi:hypothetical protein